LITYDGQVKTHEILRFPNNDGLLFNHIWGKPCETDPPAFVAIKTWQHVGFAKGVGTDLTKGHLFRPTTNDGAAIDRPFSSSAANSRLKQYLKGAGIEESATPHGFRGAI
jgi:hypothetical protein